MGGLTFLPKLARMVVAGEKTVTRRMPSDNPRSPWWSGGCGLKPGRAYAVQPGRGRPAIGRVRIVRVDLVVLGHLDDAEAVREGVADAAAFRLLWAELHGRYYRHQQVWRVEMRPVKAGPEGEQ